MDGGRRAMFSAEAEFWIVSSKQLVLAAAVLALGILAALPFRHSHVSPLPAAAIDAKSTDLTLRQRDVTLQVSGASETSPATGLDALIPFQEGVAGTETDDIRRERESLESLGSPPVMPSVFRSLVLPNTQRVPDRYEPRATVTGWTDFATGVPKDDAPQSALMLSNLPREHRIVDGDTLEKLALQYLGNPRRARELFDANRNVLEDPELLPLGKTIRIPGAADELEPVRAP